MQRSDSSESAKEFDLTQVNLKLDALKTRGMRIQVSALTAVVAAEFALVAIWFRPLLSNALSLYQTVSLLMIAGFGVWLLLFVTLPYHRRTKRGATLLRVNDHGFWLTYPDGNNYHALWLDPLLTFDLIDASDVNPSKLLSGTPYSIAAEDIRSLLPQSAYEELTRQVRAHDLAVSTSRGSPWIYASDANPLIHHIGSSLQSSRTRISS